MRVIGVIIYRHESVIADKICSRSGDELLLFDGEKPMIRAMVAVTVMFIFVSIIHNWDNR